MSDPQPPAPKTPVKPLMTDDLGFSFPRRNRVNLMTPAELAIHDAVIAVESVGASIGLTNAVILLGQARELVADFVDAQPAPVSPEPAPPPTENTAYHCICEAGEGEGHLPACVVTNAAKRWDKGNPTPSLVSPPESERQNEWPSKGQLDHEETDPWFVLDCCAAAIEDAIGLEDGLDGAAGSAVLRMIRNAEIARQSPVSPTPETSSCVRCKTTLSEGEAKTFTLCDDCWKVQYPPPTPTRDATGFDLSQLLVILEATAQELLGDAELFRSVGTGGNDILADASETDATILRAHIAALPSLVTAEARAVKLEAENAQQGDNMREMEFACLRAADRVKRAESALTALCDRIEGLPRFFGPYETEASIKRAEVLSATSAAREATTHKNAETVSRKDL